MDTLKEKTEENILLTNKAEQINKSMVIFICTFDLYKLDHYKYTFTYKCDEVPGLEYGDETTKTIINTHGTKGDVSDDLKDFLNAVNGRFSNSEFSDKIKMEVEKIKQSNDARREFMTLYLHEEDVRRQSLAKGKEEGEIKTKREDIFIVLSKLGDLADTAKYRIEKEKEITVLDKWFRLAVVSSTVEEFIEKM